MTQPGAWITVNAKYRTGKKFKKRVPAQLNKKNLQVNKTKTEKYTIKRNGKTDWKGCKYLSSLLDTEEDIKRKKNFSNSNLQQTEKYPGKQVNFNGNKTRILEVYIESVFLYNSELWILTKLLVKEIDIFQRGAIKNIFNIHWQDKITNVELYRRYKLKPWREVIKEHRMKWYGHHQRLNEKTPARLALKEAERKAKKPKGGQKLTYIKLIDKDLEEYNIPRCEAETLAQD